jgi:hypothetical protein
MVEKIFEKTGQRPQDPGAAPKLGRWAHLKGKQYSSTEQNLARQAEGKERDWDLPISPDAQVPEKIREQHIRKISPEEFSTVDAMRKRGHENSLGASVKSGSSPERIASAVHHFEVSGSVEHKDLTAEEKARITNLKPIESSEPQVEIRKLTWWQAFRYWLAGGKVWDGRE